MRFTRGQRAHLLWLLSGKRGTFRLPVRYHHRRLKGCLHRQWIIDARGEPMVAPRLVCRLCGKSERMKLQGWDLASPNTDLTVSDHHAFLLADVGDTRRNQ